MSELAKQEDILGTGLARQTYDQLLADGIQHAQTFSLSGLALGMFLAESKRSLTTQSSDLWSQFVADIASADNVLIDEETLMRYADVCIAGAIEGKWGNSATTISHWLKVNRRGIPDDKKAEMLAEAAETRMSSRELGEWVREVCGKTSKAPTRDEVNAKIATMETEQREIGNIVKRAYALINDVFLGKFDNEEGKAWLGEVRRDFGGML